MTIPRYFGLLPAAGVGARMGAGRPKQYLDVAGRPMLARAAEAFTRCPAIGATYVVVSADDPYCDAALDGVPATLLRCGGATRHESVLAGLRALRGVVEPDDWILVHDAARPGLTPALIQHLIAAAGAHAVGALLALPVVDTVKRAAGGRIETLDRAGMWLAQTPQMFRYGLLAEALGAAAPGAVTDEAGAVELLGLAPLLVEGHPRNLKVTLPRDLDTIELYLRHD